MISPTSSGLFFGYASYYVCMSACTAGAGFFAGVMSAGVATGAGIVYGVAACSTLCAGASLAACTATPFLP